MLPLLIFSILLLVVKASVVLLRRGSDGPEVYCVQVWGQDYYGLPSAQNDDPVGTAESLTRLKLTSPTTIKFNIKSRDYHLVYDHTNNLQLDSLGHAKRGITSHLWVPLYLLKDDRMPWPVSSDLLNFHQSPIFERKVKELFD